MWTGIFRGSVAPPDFSLKLRPRLHVSRFIFPFKSATDDVEVPIKRHQVEGNTSGPSGERSNYTYRGKLHAHIITLNFSNKFRAGNLMALKP